ncbi:MAG TPA: thioesterase domain-containing protein [Xanthobacteraceae bacterium]|jgi:pimeloyl-ACP methyl ester carboxylesterase
MRRFALMSALALMMIGLGSSSGMAQSRAHVYLLRGLMNIFSLGMDTLAAELNKRGVYATVHEYGEWRSLADQAAERYRAGTEGPIILIGHSLGADAVMEMAAYLEKKRVPVALLVPFDGTQSFPTPANVGRLLNFTQREYAYMTRGPGFHGSLVNLDVSSDPNIDHITIDKSPRLHARVIREVLAVLHHDAAPTPAAKPTTADHQKSNRAEDAEPSVSAGNKVAGESATPGKMNATAGMPLASNDTPAPALASSRAASTAAHNPPPVGTVKPSDAQASIPD